MIYDIRWGGPGGDPGETGGEGSSALGTRPSGRELSIDILGSRRATRSKEDLNKLQHKCLLSNKNIANAAIEVLVYFRTAKGGLNWQSLYNKRRKTRRSKADIC